MSQIASKCKALHTLDISQCSSLSDTAFEAIATLPSIFYFFFVTRACLVTYLTLDLTILDATLCNITNKALIYLSQSPNVSGFKRLVFDRCSKLSNVGTVALTSQGIYLDFGH